MNKWKEWGDSRPPTGAGEPHLPGVEQSLPTGRCPRKPHTCCSLCPVEGGLGLVGPPCLQVDSRPCLLLPRRGPRGPKLFERIREPPRALQQCLGCSLRKAGDLGQAFIGLKWQFLDFGGYFCFVLFYLKLILQRNCCCFSGEKGSLGTFSSWGFCPKTKNHPRNCWGRVFQ